MAVLAQTNVHFSNQQATNILAGNYDPGQYASEATTNPHKITLDINRSVRSDSLRSYLERMSRFETRHTSSDTASATRGIGAARRWALQKFQQISEANNDRLVCTYLNWERNICGVNEHQNIVAILPGSGLGTVNTTAPGIVIIEAHLDSRCDDGCDTSCVAHGMEDNGSGSALVLELARVMSKYQFERTIVFMLTVAEEQGLYGAKALSDYCFENDVDIAAVLNNDVIGGVICGETSSPPSCPSENHIDSTQVRLFSAGSAFSQNKQLARYIKLQYRDQLKSQVAVPMQLTIMNAEDRTGRGGDHIPFRQRGFAAMRFTSANEHGDGNPSQAGYDDRQHTSEDVLGKDTNGDGDFDEWFVDFNYLSRNAVINGVAGAMIGQNVCAPPQALTVSQEDWQTLRIDAEDEGCSDATVVIALRTVTNDWDTLIRGTALPMEVEVAPGFDYFVSAAYENGDGIEGLFSQEVYLKVVGIDEPVTKPKPIELLQNRPNPFDETTSIVFMVNEMPTNPEAVILIHDTEGALIREERLPINMGPNEIIYDHGYGHQGTFFYSLIVDDQVIDTKKMIFLAN